MRRRSPSALARSTPAELRAFEQLLATLSAGFIGLGAEHIDGAIEDALQRIARTLKLDRCSLTTISPYSGRIEVSHSWAAPGLERVPLLDIGQSNPWALGLARAGQPVVFSRLDDWPEVARDDADGRGRPASRRLELRRAAL